MNPPDGRAPRRRVAFVTQRYGVEVNGGAEYLCRMVAERMARHWDVEVLTTCAIDYMTWVDYYPAGVETLNGVTVRRFPVAEPRDVEHFNRLSEALRANPRPSLEDQEQWMRAQGPWSPTLLRYIETDRAQYDLVIFFGYLYAQTYFGLRLAGDRAVLVPFAHDEWTIHLPMWDAIFAMPRAIVFSTIEEQRFLARRFRGARLRGPVVGAAVERPREVSPQRFRREHRIGDSFVLYVGRVDPSKGCGEMFEHYLHHAAATGDARPLVTIGRAVMPVPSHPQVLALGFVSEQVKWDALAACDLLVMPSPYESLSIVLLEAWSVMKPALVNGRSEVLRGQVCRANGGLAYSDRREFSAALATLSNGAAASVLGRQGHDYVRNRYSWKTIEAEYLEVAAAVQGNRP